MIPSDDCLRRLASVPSNDPLDVMNAFYQVEYTDNKHDSIYSEYWQRMLAVVCTRLSGAEAALAEVQTEYFALHGRAAGLREAPKTKGPKA